MSLFYLGLGSNLGNRSSNLEAAISALADCGDIKARSSIYETEPKYDSNQPKFLNMVCALESELAAVELFEAAKTIEVQLGRLTTHKNGPRTIDIDLLYSPDESCSDPFLQIPHLRLAERAFVLVPLAEMAPSLYLQHLSCTAEQLLQRLDKNLISEVSLFESA